MKILLIFRIVASVTCFSIGLFVFCKNRKSQINISYFYLCIAVSLWQLFYAIFSLNFNKDILNYLARISYIPVIFITPTYHHFLSNFIDSKRYRGFIRINYAIALIFTALSLMTNFFVEGYYKYPWGYYPKASIVIHPIFLLWVSAVAVSASYFSFQIIFKYNISCSRDTIQRKYVCISFLAFILAVQDFVPNYGINLYPFGSFFVLLSLMIFMYAIVKHHLMDITIVIKKGLVYSVLVAIITVGYLVFVMSIGRLFQGLVGYQSSVVNIFAVIAIGILFNPLRDRIQHFLDKRFFQGTLESLAQDKQRLQQELFQTEKLAYVGQLASSVAHEIRNPLTVIETHLEYLPKKYSDPEFRRKFEHLVPKEIERIKKVVNQLLSLAKPRKPILRPLNIIDVIDSTTALLENNFKLKKIKITKKYSENEAIIQGGEEQLRQVFLNLFLNSIQAMDEGGELTIEVENLRSSALDSRSSAFKSVIICVKDTGCGISEENLKKLFTPFRTTKEDGIGLGLVITQEIITAHKGMIEVESRIEEGAKFVIELPASA